MLAASLVGKKGERKVGIMIFFLFSIYRRIFNNSRVNSGIVELLYI